MSTETGEGMRQAVQQLIDRTEDLVTRMTGMEQFRNTADQAMTGFEDRLTQIGMAVQEMRNTVQGTPVGRTGERREDHRERDVEESKAISNLPVFQGGERGVYKEWHEKFVNVFTQVRKGTRSLLEELETTKEEYWADMDFDTWARARGVSDGKYDGWSADLWWVLIEKTSGEALQRVKGTKRGEGMEAYRRLHQWYARQTTMTMQELRMKVMRPGQARNEGEVAQKLEEWTEAKIELDRMEKNGDGLPEQWQVAAVRGILAGKIKEHMDLRMAEKELGIEELVREVRKYAGMRRAEAKGKRNDDAMDVDQVRRHQGMGQTTGGSGMAHPPGMEEWNDWNWGTGNEEEEGGDVDQLGGKGGKGKGGLQIFYGKCDHCKIAGHKKEMCPYLGKGFKGTCNACGLYGHSARYCPSQGDKGKGKGKGKDKGGGKGYGGYGGKGKGKGKVNEVEQGYEEEETGEQEAEGDVGGIWQIAGAKKTARWTSKWRKRDRSGQRRVREDRNRTGTSTRSWYVRNARKARERLER